ncbi:TIGR02450 family Trp-rich protein [Marinomonas sp. THO17]|uniref:TIGR02450 family Trp-rich protein n=1 Tax=Marinomonas sp. THO17 TaxID=3149048 RepID=UPI00336C0586
MNKNQINPDKLLLSKWTSRTPQQKEKHFIVTELFRDENDQILECLLEAVINKNQYRVVWQELANIEQWQQGWK